DPYLGVAKQQGGSGGFAGASVVLSFAFTDVFGNELAATPPIADLTAPVAYYDPVLGLSSWPAASGTFAISSAARLVVGVDLGLDKYVPGPANPFAAAVRTAAAHRTIYGQVYYQLLQPDVGCAVTCSLGGELVSGSAAKRPLQAFATAAYLYLGSARAVQQVWFEVGDAGQTLGGVASAYAVTAGELVAANAAADVTTLTSAQLTIPHDWAVRSTDTLGSISTATGIPVPTLLTTNQQVPLNTGCVLQTGTITFTTRPGDTFTTVAALMATTIAAIAVANTDSTGILTPGTVTIGGVSVPVTAQDSLGSLVTALHDKGVDTTVAAIATAYANSGLLVSGVPIAVAAVPATPGDTTGVRHHAVAQGESLSHIVSSTHGTLPGVALANAQLTGLLRAGVTVEVKGVSAAVGTDGSLAGLLAALLKAGGTEVVIGLADVVAALAADETILVEGASVAVVDYVVAKGDTAASVTKSVQGFTMAQFARLAAPGPQGVYPTGASLRLSTTAYTALPGDTFAGIAAEFGIGTDELAEANTGLALTVGAQLAAPGAVTLGTVHGAVCVPMTGGVPTLAQLATASGMSPADLGQANATVPDLLAPDVRVTYQGNTTTTTAGSTLASVAAAVHAADAATLVADPEVSALPNLVAPGALVLIGSVAPAGRSLDATASALGVQADDLATANSAVVGLLKSVPITVRGVTVTPQATDTLASVVRRLQRGTAAGAPPITLSDLLSAYGGDVDLFAADARLLVPPARVEMSADLTTPHVRAPLTPLSAAVTIRRDAALVDPLAAGIGTVVSDTTALSPDFGADGKVDGFAHAFETAYAARRLKLTTGPRTGDGAPPLWVVDFGPNGVSAVKVRPDQPRFFALAPMSRELLGGTVPVGEYDPATGALDPATPKTFTAVDVDAWMRTALEAVDLFLGPTVAARAWQVQPAGFTTVVEGKQTIADALAGRVQPVLGDPVTADALAAARETLRQSMADTLATGYTTDAVVQFPVTVESPFGPVRTTGSSGAALKGLASAYGVSPQHLASAFADVPSILAVGTTVHAGANSHQITATDTLATVASALHLAGVTALPFDQTVFAANTTPDLAPMTHQVVAGDTFAGLAGYVGTDPGTVGVAAQDVVGLLKPGTVITSGDLSHVVTADDTLGKVAAAVGTTPAVLAARSDLAGDTALLVAGKPVACFSPLNPIPPRLVGRPVATRYEVPAAGDVESLLVLYGVSLAALAGAIGGMAGILTAGVVVGGSYHVVEGDTLTTVARALSPARTVLDLLTGVRDGSVTVTGGTLFRAGAVIAVSKLTRRPTDADSFAALADHFGQSPAEVAVANQDVVGALRAGLTFTHLQHSYTTDGSETIALVANRLAYPSAGAFASDPAVVVRTGVFAGDRSLHAVQAVPDFSLSSLKVPLAGGTQYAGFLFSTAADARYRSLFLDVDLVLDELEFGIRDVVDGYQGSDWLRFPVPLRHSCLGGAVELDADGTDVPIALRSYPQLPLVRALQADPTWGGEGFPVRTIAEGKQWQLTATVEHQSSAQDEMRLQVSFGSPADAVYAAAEGDNLLGPLAQFTIAWAAMQHDVAALSALAPGVVDTRLGAMVSTFASLVSTLAAALAADTAALMAAPADETYLFSLDTTVDSTDDHLDSVNVTLLDGPTGDVPWPAIAVDVAGKPVPLTAEGVVAGKSQRYAYPAHVPAFASLTHHYVFPGTAVPNGVPPVGRDAVRWQHGQCVVSVLRNVPLVAGNPTNPDFVYQTPWIGFANPAVPLLRSAAPIQVGTGPGLADGVRSALAQLLGATGSTTYRFRVLCHYERHLVTSTNGNGTALVSPLPVFYVPLVHTQPSGVDQFAETAGQQAAMWLRTTAITPGVGDAYVLDISVFSNDDTQMTRPLVELTRLTVPL
ncbi:MAG: LysM peptidoglycan-binding domain-containing protein, partial [Saccharothrix sp.]|nr:LysM peptidoglycan-binding domain-containing protein [Saccharothrix sp.]